MSDRPDAGKKPKAGDGTPLGPADERARLVYAQQAIGSFLRSAREAQKLTQEQVASMTRDSPWQLSRAAISAIERGQNFPGMEAMLALSNVLFIDPKELIERARLSTIVPVDITGVSLEELSAKGSDAFWSGDYRRAVAIYDAMLERIALEESDRDRNGELASVEVKRATALNRAGALMAALGAVERAISLGQNHPEQLASAYVLLADLQCSRGHLPLAKDAAEAATRLSVDAGDHVQGWAWMAVGRVNTLIGEFEQGRQAYIKARDLCRAANDQRHLTTIEGNIGLCWRGLGQPAEARKWLRRAVELSRQQGQPALEAIWLVELGRLGVEEDRLQDAEAYANAALRIAKPRDHHKTIFRAEWLLHRIIRKNDPENPDRHRLHYLRRLFHHLDQHDGIEEVHEFKTTVLRAGD